MLSQLDRNGLMALIDLLHLLLLVRLLLLVSFPFLIGLKFLECFLLLVGLQLLICFLLLVGLVLLVCLSLLVGLLLLVHLLLISLSLLVDLLLVRLLFLVRLLLLEEFSLLIGLLLLISLSLLIGLLLLKRFSLLISLLLLICLPLLVVLFPLLLVGFQFLNGGMDLYIFSRGEDLMQRVALRWWVTTRRWRRRGARFSADGHICSRRVLRRVAERLLLALRLTLSRRGRRRVVELDRWRWRRAHRWRRDVIGGRGIGQGGGVLFSTTALDITRAAELGSHKPSIFFLIHPKFLLVIIIILIWEAHLHNILSATPRKVG